MEEPHNTFVPEDSDDSASLQQHIEAQIAIAKHMRIRVAAVDESRAVLTAPLDVNVNDKGTAFAGSLFSVAVLAGWVWVTQHLSARGIAADVMVQEANVSYRMPVTAEFKAVAQAPAQAEIDKLDRMLRRTGRGRVALRVTVFQQEKSVLEFSGAYAAVLRASE